MKSWLPARVGVMGGMLNFLPLLLLFIMSPSVLLMAEDAGSAADNTVIIDETVKKDDKAAVEDESCDQTQDRIIFSRTALGNRPRDLHLTGYAAGIWDIDYTVNPNVTIGVAVQLPILSVGAIPHISFNKYVTRNFALGAGLFAGVWVPYVDNGDGNVYMGFGGHAAATWVKGPHMVNLGVMAADCAGFNKKSKFSIVEGLGVLASFGYRYSINKNWAFLLEVHTPFVIDFNKSLSWNVSKNKYGQLWAVMYGFRGHGGDVFGDIGFILPLEEWYIKSLWLFLPLGIPYFSIGMKF